MKSKHAPVELPYGTVVLEGSVGCDALAIDPVEMRMKALRKSIYNAGLQHEKTAAGFRCDNVWMVSLTYAGVDDWKKYHIAALIACYKAWARRRGVAKLKYCWVMELQKRGAPHYHIIFYLPRHLACPKPDKQGWWKFGSTNRGLAKKKTGYLMKYVSKCGDLGGHKFPKGARIWGIGGLDAEGRRVVRYWKAPKWVRDKASAGLQADLVRLAAGWCCRVAGETFKSTWRFLCMAYGRPVVYKVFDPEPEHVCINVGFLYTLSLDTP